MLTARQILERVERREMQVDVAVNMLDDIYHTGERADVVAEVPEDAIPQALTTSPPVGTLTSYGGAETRQSRSDEPLPLSEDQEEEVENPAPTLDDIVGALTAPAVEGGDGDFIGGLTADEAHRGAMGAIADAADTPTETE